MSGDHNMYASGSGDGQRSGWRKREIMEMAREAGVVPYVFSSVDEECLFRLKAFEALVRADEAEKYTWDIHSCGPTCTKIGCVAVREAVKAEREACAKLCEDSWMAFSRTPNRRLDITPFPELEYVAKVIRARGQA